MKKILVTGSEGFIGSHVVEHLVYNNYKVKCLVLYNSFGSIGNLAFLSKKILSKCEIIFGDVRDNKLITNITKGCDGIINLASLIGIPYSYKAIKSYLDTNIYGTYNLLEASLHNKIKKFIHTSTSEVYGTAQKIPMDENHPLVAQSPYAASKISADALVNSYFSSFGLNTLVIRPFNTYGPRQSQRAVIPTIICQTLKNKNIFLGDLKPKRDFTYVNDTAMAFVKSLKLNSMHSGQVINLGTGISYTINEVTEIISKILKKKINIKIDKKRIRPKKSEVMNLLSDNKKSKKILKWSPSFYGNRGMEKGLRITIDYYKYILNNKIVSNDFIY